jgi:hypothetical protein
VGGLQAVELNAHYFGRADHLPQRAFVDDFPEPGATLWVPRTLRAALAQGPGIGGVFRDGRLRDREAYRYSHAIIGPARGGLGNCAGVMRWHRLSLDD